MRTAGAIGAALLLSGAALAVEQSPLDPAPLLALADELRGRAPRDTDDLQMDPAGGNAALLREARHALRQADPPPGGECATTLGAGHFSELHANLAEARLSLADHAGAAEAYRAALECRPRSKDLRRQLAATLYNTRDVPAARAALRAGLLLDPRDISLNELAGYVDFAEGRWADAVSRFRFVASAAMSREAATYAQILLWLAQRRVGIAHPELVARKPSEYWPQPALEYLRDGLAESQLANALEEGEDSREPLLRKLSEALIFVGQERLARGDVPGARAHFAAAVASPVRNPEMNTLALSEIARLRAHQGRN